MFFKKNINLLAGFIVFLFAVIMLFGAKDSTLINNIVWLINMGTLIFSGCVGLFYCSLDHFSNFFRKGFDNLFSAAGRAFFAFIGFDTAAAFI